jgi:hypothetical protein
MRAEWAQIEKEGKERRERREREREDRRQNQINLTSTNIWIKRGDTVKGPISLDKMQKLIQSEQTRMTDEVALAEDGPWKPLKNVYKSIMNK